jgi:hypothetical protein
MNQSGKWFLFHGSIDKVEIIRIIYTQPVIYAFRMHPQATLTIQYFGQPWLVKLDKELAE